MACGIGDRGDEPNVVRWSQKCAQHGQHSGDRVTFSVFGQGIFWDAVRCGDRFWGGVQFQASTPGVSHRGAHAGGVNDGVVQFLVGGGNRTLIAVVGGILAWVLLDECHDASRVERIMNRLPSGVSTEKPAPRPSTTSNVMWEPRM